MTKLDLGGLSGETNFDKFLKELLLVLLYAIDSYYFLTIII